jgi:hypothetical protein
VHSKRADATRAFLSISNLAMQSIESEFRSREMRRLDCLNPGLRPKLL